MPGPVFDWDKHRTEQAFAHGPAIEHVVDGGCCPLPVTRLHPGSCDIPVEPLKENAWIEERVGIYQEPPVDLCFWLGLRGVGTVQRLRFARVLDAERFYAWNLDSHICQQCCRNRGLQYSAEPSNVAFRDKPPFGRYCSECHKELELLHDLERRWQLACTIYERQAGITKRLEELRELLGENDFTDSDKAAVLDRLLIESAQAESPQETAV